MTPFSNDAVQVGLVSAALVLLLLHLMRRIGNGEGAPTVAGASSVLLAFLALGAVAGSLGGTPTPAASFERIEAAEVVGSSNLPQDILAVEAALPARAHGDLRRLVEEGRPGQIVGSSSLVELATGVASVNVINQPSYLSIAVGMLRLQCEEMADRPETAVIMAEWVAAGLVLVEVRG